MSRIPPCSWATQSFSPPPPRSRVRRERGVCRGVSGFAFRVSGHLGIQFSAFKFPLPPPPAPGTPSSRSAFSFRSVGRALRPPRFEVQDRLPTGERHRAAPRSGLAGPFTGPKISEPGQTPTPRSRHPQHPENPLGPVLLYTQTACAIIHCSPKIDSHSEGPDVFPERKKPNRRASDLRN